MRILLVDDDEALMETLAEALIKQRYAVDIATDGETAREFLALFSYDLIVLDMLLPDVGGIVLCQEFREAGLESPILVLSARDTSLDKVQALDAGADDYVIKPFDFDELCARIRALLRRESHSPTTTLTWGDLQLTPDTFQVFYGEHQLHVTPKEYALLELLLRHPSRVFSLDSIIDNLWSFQDPPSEDAVRTHVKGVRQKLKAGGAPKDLIETVYGVGYRLKPLDADPPQPAPPSPPQQPTKSDIAVAIANAWDTHKGEMRARLRVLESVAIALRAGTLDPELQASGHAQAHKLSGALGCYGLSEGSQLARQLEQILQLDVPLDSSLVPQVCAIVDRLRQRLEADSASPTAIAADEAQGLAQSFGQPAQKVAELWVVGASEPFNRAITAEAIAAGLCAVAIAEPSEARVRLQDHSPDGILLWPDGNRFDDAMALLSVPPSAQGQGPPMLVVTDSKDFHQRLHMVQQGADRLLSSAVSPQEAIAAFQRVRQTDRSDIKVLILDDDAQVLDLLKTLLSPWGFQLTTLDNPSRLMPVLERVRPDLLVLDVEMPEANGLEICQVLRADETWWQLPILFLTVHGETTLQQQAFNVGADDFVSKSAMADLPARILNRLKRQDLG
ncbi:MAG: response regulator [Elainellaceae cyanobacterium]